MFDLNTLWFILIAILWIGFYFLEGFDFGVGMLLPFIGKKDEERRAVINTIGPHWDGNEVWLLTAGGATFAAFPQWYATMFSGFYLAFFLLLLGLIVRGVAFEFRSKDYNPKWRRFWDWAIFGGSLVPALLLGIAFANLARGVPIDANGVFTGNLLTLLNPYGLLGGVATVAVFLLHGAVFLSLKAGGTVQERAEAWAKKLWVPVAVLVLVLAIATLIATDLIARRGINPGIFPLSAVTTILLAGWFVNRKQNGWAFAMTGLHIVLTQITFFLILFPRVLISTIDPAFSLDIYNAASSPYTLRVMTIVAAIFVPMVLLYQGYTYWVFRKRVMPEKKDLVY
ncbi:MAG: cytochrome d ubiquinol oxidase subunit II [Anaerolineales bacterium]|nr:cytochrome d ubiquinol oxidase subunit II [Anaerolineales bacterium]